MSGSKAARKVAMLRKAKPERRHARFYEWELDSAAFRSLDVYARALLIEFKALYNGANNGELYMAVRDACTRLGTTTTRLAVEALRQLEDRGFIVATRKGAMTRRDENKLATSWRLTEFDDDLTDQPATKDFMSWRPATTSAPDDLDQRARYAERARKAAAARWAKKIRPMLGKHSTDAWQACDQPKKRLTDACQATVEPDSDSLTDACQATQIYLPGEGAAGTDSPDPDHDPTPSPADPMPSARVGLWLVSDSEQKTAKPPKKRRAPRNGSACWPAAERVAAGLTQGRLAELAGVQRAYLSVIEQGRRQPSVEVRARIERALQERAS